MQNPKANFLSLGKSEYCEISYAYFDHLSSDTNGGAINVNDISLHVYNSLFRSCKVKQNELNGGSIYVTISNTKFNSTINKICETDGFSFQGFLIYASLNENFLFAHSSSLTFSTCSNKAGIYSTKSSLISSNNNYSYNKPKVCHCHQAANSYYVYSKYNIFYGNADDCIFYYGSFLDEGTYLENSIFVDNTKSSGDLGYIHINVADNQKDYAINITFINNTHYMFDANRGTIIAKNIYYDKWNTKTKNIQLEGKYLISTLPIDIKTSILENKCESMFIPEYQKSFNVKNNYQSLNGKFLFIALICS